MHCKIREMQCLTAKLGSCEGQTDWYPMVSHLQPLFDEMIWDIPSLNNLTVGSSQH